MGTSRGVSDDSFVWLLGRKDTRIRISFQWQRVTGRPITSPNESSSSSLGLA
ncbi:hypothetical protein HAX54_031071, partial [Datura stramonium]|nr:hypothetical protein [Datura stramonium]